MGSGNKRNNRNNRSIYTVGKYIEICLDKNKNTMRRTKSESSIYSYSADSTRWNKLENSENITEYEEEQKEDWLSRIYGSDYKDYLINVLPRINYSKDRSSKIIFLLNNDKLTNTIDSDEIFELGNEVFFKNLIKIKNWSNPYNLENIRFILDYRFKKKIDIVTNVEQPGEIIDEEKETNNFWELENDNNFLNLGKYEWSNGGYKYYTCAVYDTPQKIIDIMQHKNFSLYNGLQKYIFLI